MSHWSFPRLLVWATLLGPVLAPLVATALQAEKVWRGDIPLLSPTTLAMGSSVLVAFRQELREAAYHEGQNIVLEYRSEEGRVDRLPGLETELVQLGVHLIFATHRHPALTSKQATATMPSCSAEVVNDCETATGRIYCRTSAVAVSAAAGGLIQTAGGSCGGTGGRWTKRSGWAA